MFISQLLKICIAALLTYMQRHPSGTDDSMFAWVANSFVWANTHANRYRIFSVETKFESGLFRKKVLQITKGLSNKSLMCGRHKIPF